MQGIPRILRWSLRYAAIDIIPAEGFQEACLYFASN
jgi:hypothetical protein